jgi:TfoX/Sxy family transcriptional regulator of competence genes
MSTKESTIEYILDQLSKVGDVSARKMFGEYAIYLSGTVVALVCDDELYVKPTVAGRKLLREVHEAPPYPGAKNYFHIPADEIEDREYILELMQATAKELLTPKKKNKKPSG